MPAVFISYSRKDSAFVRRLHDSLVARQYDVWVDWEDIPPSAEWFEEIRRGVRHADGFIYVISPDSVSSQVCSRELESAFDQNKRVVPVVCREPDGAQVPERAASLNWVFLRDSDNYDDGLHKLVTALETDLEYVRVHTRLGVQADRWESSGRDASQLLRGSDLSAAESWLVGGAGKRPETTQRQREYLLASRQAASRRQRTVIGAVTAALAIAVVLAIVALVQRSTAIHERNVAYARQLDADAQANLSTDPELSVLLASRAARAQASPATAATLRQALGESNVRERFALPSTFAAGDVLPSPDGTRLLLTGPGLGTASWARIYSPGSTRPLVSLPGPTIGHTSGWSANGLRVVVGNARPVVYDAATGRALVSLPKPSAYAALTPDGSRVVTVDFHAVGHVYDVASGHELASFHPRFTGGTSCFALSPDGRYVAQCDIETRGGVSAVPADVDVWSVATGALVRRVSSPTQIGSVSFSGDSKRFAYTTTPSQANSHTSITSTLKYEGAPGTLVYDTSGSGGPVITFPGAASAAAFSPSGRFQALAYATVDDDIVHVYDFYSKLTFSLPGATSEIETMAWDDSQGYLAAASADNVRVYSAIAGGSPLETLAGHRGRVRSVGFADGADYVATSADDGTARLWQGPTPTPALQRRDTPVGDGGVPTVGFTLTGDRVVVAGQGPTLSPQGRILAATTLKTQASFTLPAGQVLAGAVTSRDGHTIAALAAGHARAALVGVALDTFDAHTGAHLATLAPAAGHTVLDGGVNYAGDQAATLESGGRAELWDARSGRLLHVLNGFAGPGVTLTFSRNDHLLAVAHDPALPAQLAGQSTGHPVIVQLWDTRTGQLARTISAEDLETQIPGEKNFPGLGLAFSPDGRTLALSGAQPNVQLFSVATGTVKASLSIAGLSAGSYAPFVQFSPDGTMLAAGSVTGAYVWRVPSLQRLAVFAHTSPTISYITPGNAVRVGFSLDSRELVTYGGVNGEPALEVWDIPDHQQVFSVGQIASGSLAPRGDRVVTASALGGISVYDCALCGGLPQLFRMAAQRVTRGLTPAERHQYLTGG